MPPAREKVTSTDRPIIHKITVNDHYIHRQSELESLPLYDFAQSCHMELIKAATNYSDRSVPGNDVNVPRAKRGRHVEPWCKFRDAHPALGKFIVTMRTTKVFSVSLFSNEVIPSFDIGSIESWARISTILFRTSRVISGAGNRLTPEQVGL
ncbi:hypothetical protein H9P43_003581 [Blastocladiella emersonii ATCC 22665]|nr:hypothetical protein H9P43_003581 [Blastocladiella emersonii ATCC 22665]